MEPLSPGEIATDLFTVAPDRDERGSQVCVEALLTLTSNNYQSPSSSSSLKSPKRGNFALRSLVLGENFYAGLSGDAYRIPKSNLTLDSYGQCLAEAKDFAGSENLANVRDALDGLVDPQTRRGASFGVALLYPLHQDLLWYDARKSGGGGMVWAVRKVYMRGSGITFARLLLDPPGDVSEDVRRAGATVCAALQAALCTESQMSVIATALERPIADLLSHRITTIEPDETRAWDAGGKPALVRLSSAICLHSQGIFAQTNVGPTAKLWSFRNMLTLDFAMHALRTAWEESHTPQREQYLLLCFGGPPRAENIVRQFSEDSYERSRTKLREAIISRLSMRMRDAFIKMNNGEHTTVARVEHWKGMFEQRKAKEALREEIDALGSTVDVSEIPAIARRVFAKADYDRPMNGYRVLLESAEVLQGTGQYRFLSASPDLMAAFVGALAEHMPMTSRDFFERVFAEWHIVISPEAAAHTNLPNKVDGAELARNARRAERLLVNAGLAEQLSDSTTIVGEYVRRSESAVAP